MHKASGLFFLAVIIVFIFFSCKAVSISEESLESKWKLEISLEKDTFLLRELIWLDVVLTNTSEDTLRSWGLFPPCQGSEFRIELTDSIGISVPYSGPLYDIIRGNGFLIFPEEQYYNCFDLINLFAVVYTSTYDFGMLPPGRYSVQGVYAETISNKISFIIVDSQGKEKDAEQSIIEAYKTDFRRLPKPTLSKMFVSYPKSVYTEILALGFLGYSDFLNKFPNSGHTRSSLTGEMMGLTDEEKIEYLENAIIKYSGTRAAKHAEQLLRRQRKLTKQALD